MTYETYIFLKSLLDNNIEKQKNDYLLALSFIPTGNKYKAAQDAAHKIFQAEYSKRLKMAEELHQAAAEFYKNHPNKEMREFWGWK